MDGGRKEILGTIQQQQITVLMEYVLLQHLATLQLTKHVTEQRTQGLRINAIQNLTQSRVAWHLPNTKQPFHVFIAATSVKRQQRRILQCEQGQSGHQGVGQRNRSVGVAMIWNSLAPLANQAIQRIGSKMFANLRRKRELKPHWHGDSFRRKTSILQNQYES
jgi:hypothetical protein